MRYAVGKSRAADEWTLVTAAAWHSKRPGIAEDVYGQPMELVAEFDACSWMEAKARFDELANGQEAHRTKPKRTTQARTRKTSPKKRNSPG